VAVSPILDRDEVTADHETPTPQPAPTLLRWGVAGVLVALVVAAVAALGVQAVHRGGNPFSTTDDVQTTRDAVMSQARQFMLRVNTYGPDLLQGTKMPTYRSRIAAVVTSKFEADFEKNVPYAEATVAQAGLARTTQVYGVGVGDLDADRGRATALVAGAFTNSFPDPKDKTKRVPADRQPYRVEVTLVRQGGTWKVDAFAPVGNQPSGQPSAQPSPAAPAPSAEGSAR
jgi:Mce-associated membrane protein